MKNKKIVCPPTTEQLEGELKRVRYKSRYRSVLRSTIYSLITVAAIAVLITTLWFPVLRVYGNSMTPTLQNGEIIFTVKVSEFEPGDIISFYYNNKILIKRVIARSGEWVNMDADGNVYVNETLLDEPYLDEKTFGDQVPEGRVFVMGDQRSTSVDSRNSAVGCVAQEQIVGKILFRVWPLEKFGWVK